MIVYNNVRKHIVYMYMYMYDTGTSYDVVHMLYNDYVHLRER